MIGSRWLPGLNSSRGFGIAIRRGELKAAQEDATDPIASLAGLEFFFPAHGGGAGRELLRVEQVPRARVTLGVEGQSAIGVIVLSEAPLQIGGLTNIDFTFRVLQDLDEKSHCSMAPRARFELATLRLTAECSTVELPGSSHQR